MSLPPFKSKVPLLTESVLSFSLMRRLHAQIIRSKSRSHDFFGTNTGAVPTRFFPVHQPLLE